ncbi:MAG: hypothetical protein ACYSUT_02375 [Planctomycetota bacterium]
MYPILMKTVRVFNLLGDKCWLLWAYILSTYLFFLPWLPFWGQIFEDDNGMVVMAATVMLFLSPLIFPLTLGMMGLSLYVQVAEKNMFLAVAAFFLPLLYYAVILAISVLIVRYLNRRVSRWINKKMPAL